MANIAKYIPWLLCIILAVCLFKTCGKKPAPEKVTVTTTITKWLPSPVVTIHDTPKLAKSTPQPIPKAKQPSANCDTAKQQVIDCNEALFAINEFDDTARHDSSWVAVHTTVQGNQIIGADYAFQLRGRQVTTTIDNTVTLAPKRQVLLGGGISGNLNTMEMHIGGLYKNKKGNEIGLHGGLNNLGQWVAGTDVFFKLHFGK